jgi:hypothetical protein
MAAALKGGICRGSVEVPYTTMVTWLRLVALQRYWKLLILLLPAATAVSPFSATDGGVLGQQKSPGQR